MTKILNFVSGAGFGFLAIAVIIPVGFPLVSAIEGKFFPVVRDTEILDLRKTGNWISIDVRWRNTRDCEFLSLRWYVDTPAGKQRVRIEFPDSQHDDGDQSRGDGVHIARGWLLNISPSAFGDSVAEVTHNCHPLWETRSRFHPHG